MARPKGTIERIQTGLRLKKSLFRQLQHLALDIETPVNAIVENAIEEYLLKRGPKRRRSGEKEKQVDTLAVGSMPAVPSPLTSLNVQEGSVPGR